MGTAWVVVAIFAMALMASGGAWAAEIHVAPGGSDANPGSEAKPVATLEKARALVRAADPAKPRHVVLHGGAYHLTAPLHLGAEDSGTAEAPVIWRAKVGAQVRLVGGVAVAPDAFAPVSDLAVLARLDPAAREAVLVADLAALGATTVGGYPDRIVGAPEVPELFYDDQRMTVARWPNRGWATIARIVEAGARPADGDKSGKPGSFEYSGDRPSRWNAAGGVWLRGYWCYDWSEETIRVGAIDPQTRTIKLAAPHVYSLMTGNPSPRRFYALNLLEELDQPGEYCIDAAAGKLYFWPPGPLASARVVLSRLTRAVVLLDGAKDVVLRGLTVEASVGHGIEVRGGARCAVEACVVRNTRLKGVFVSGGERHHVEACDIFDTGEGGIHLAGGDRKTLTPGGHEALNNHIHHFSRLRFTYASGIHISGVGHRAAHNLIHDAPHMAVGLDGNDHLFEYNVVHDVCTETDDAGAFYKGRDPSARGNIVRHNFWHHIGSPMGHGTAAVYFDDGDGGDLVEGNLFVNCGEPGRASFGSVFSHGGHDLAALNNVFVSCRRALGSAPWDDKHWRLALDGGAGCLWKTRLLENVDITRPPYTTRYPALVGYLDFKPGTPDQPSTPRVSHARGNVFYLCGEPSNQRGNWVVKAEENWSTEQDPGFVDAARGDFRFRADAPAVARLKGFAPPQFEKMGLVVSPLRLKVTREAWKYGAPESAPMPGSKPPPAK